MTDLTVSVVVVSRNRPEALQRCLAGLEQLDYPAFEVIVVADPGGMAALDRAGVTDRIKTIAFDQPNISAARNLGVCAAAGDVVAFIDDDSVPEPSWLRFLAGPFAAADVVAAGGYLRGRNGISFQSTAQSVDALGRHGPLDVQEETVVFAGKPGRAIKTEGTNCAFRRAVLLDLGGFDPAFHYYMDETDLNMRIAAAGLGTAIVPMAQVHHGFAASAQRHASRMPRTLFDVGASSAVFLGKHAPADRMDEVIAAIRAEQRARLLRHMVAGTCEPRDVGRLLQTLEAGFADGQRRPISECRPLVAVNQRFRRFAASKPFSRSVVLAGRTWTRRHLRIEAAGRVKDGSRVSLFLFSPTTFFHHVRFDSRGFWEQRGGLFGKSDRNESFFRLTLFGTRLEQETKRVQKLRLFTK